MNKPTYIAFATLDMSNLHMNEIYYDNLQPFLEMKIHNYII